MKRLYIVIFVALWCLISLANAQQCTEDTQLARLSPAIVGGSVPSGGCTDPAAGTTLGGNETVNDSTTDYTLTDTGVWTNQGYSVTWAETCTTTTVSKLQMYGNADSGAGNLKIVLYTAAGAWVATTNAVANTGWSEPGVPTWRDFTFVSAPTVTKGATYKVIHVSDANNGASLQLNNATGDIYSQGTFTYASPAANLAGSDTTSNGTFAVRIVK